MTVKHFLRMAIPVLAAASMVSPSAAQEQQALPVGGIAHVDASANVGIADGTVPQTRLQTRDLGIAPYDIIPAGQTAITSLAVGPEGNIYGATSGETANLLVFSHQHNIVYPLGTIPGHESVYHSLVNGGDGGMYLGTMMNPFREYYPKTEDGSGRNWFYTSVKRQIDQDYAAYGGGHIYRYDPGSTRISFIQERFRIDKPCPLEDLGVPVPNEGIFTLIAAPETGDLYGVTFPGGTFFRFDIAERKTEIISTLNSITPVGFSHPPITRALVRDAYGNIYAAIDNGYLARYTPGTGVLDTLNVRLPGLTGRELYNRLDAAVLHPSGDIYGGTSDGYLFRFDPDTASIRNLGKPFIETRIRCMSVADDGRIFGIGGEDRGVGRLFSYDPTDHAIKDHGVLDVAVVPYYEWKGLVFDSMVTGPDACIYIGNSEHRSKLFIYSP